MNRIPIRIEITNGVPSQEAINIMDFQGAEERDPMIIHGSREVNEPIEALKARLQQLCPDLGIKITDK